MPPTATATATAAHDADDASAAAAAAAAKRQREYPWRDEYDRDYGVRPVLRDEATGEVVLVECKFCARFGREDPVTLENDGLPRINALGRVIKPRARTRNVAQWKHPYRSDNIRSHHIHQHPHKWREYTELLRLVRDEERAAKKTQRRRKKARTMAATTTGAESGEDAEEPTPGGPSADDAAPKDPGQTKTSQHLDRLLAFFGDDAPPPPPRITAIKGRGPPQALLNDPCRLRARLITTGDIVRDLLPQLRTPDGHERSLSVSFFDVPPPPPRGTSPAPVTIDVPHESQFQFVHRLVFAGLQLLDIERVARVLHAATRPDDELTLSKVFAYAEVLVAASLEDVALALQGQWTYSFHLVVHEPTPMGPAMLDLRVRVPRGRGVSLTELHVLALPLYQFEHAPAQVQAQLQTTLDVLDRRWRTKMLGVTVGGAPYALGVHANLIDWLAACGQTPLYRVANGFTKLNEVMRNAWMTVVTAATRINGGAVTQDAGEFFRVLQTLTEVFRTGHDSGSGWTQRHGPCPRVSVHDPWSALRGLEWLITRKDAVADFLKAASNARPGPIASLVVGSWWWLVAFVVVDVLRTCERAIARGRRLPCEGFIYPSETTRIATQLVVDIAEKCCIASAATSTSSAMAHVPADTGVLDGDDLSWPREHVVACFRSLNLSTRRIFGELDQGEQTRAELAIVRIVPHVLAALSEMTATATDSEDAELLPLVFPLDFARIHVAAVVDAVEQHSERLRAHFPPEFVDKIADDIRELARVFSGKHGGRIQTNVLRTKLLALQDGAELDTAFQASWDEFKHFPALREFAAGLATALPLVSSLRGDDGGAAGDGAGGALSGSTMWATANANRGVVHLRADPGDRHRRVLADLGLEAHLHSLQWVHLGELAQERSTQEGQDI